MPSATVQQTPLVGGKISTRWLGGRIDGASPHWRSGSPARRSRWWHRRRPPPKAPIRPTQARARSASAASSRRPLGPPDAVAFFNYTDYERNALRLARLRVFAEWRPAPSLAAVGELRVENAAQVEAAAAYLRWRPWHDRDLVVQAGRIPPVVGAYSRHAYGRDNLVMGMPLAYQYLTSLRPDALPATIDDVLRMRGRGWRPSFPLGSTAVAPGIPLVSAARWDTGVQVLWRRQWLAAAGAVTLGAPAVPVVHDRSDGQQWSGRAAVHLPDGLTLGVSGARGAWIDREVLAHPPAFERSGPDTDPRRRGSRVRPRAAAGACRVAALVVPSAVAGGAIE